MKKSKRKKAPWVDVFKPLPTEKFTEKERRQNCYRKEAARFVKHHRDTPYVSCCLVMEVVFGKKRVVTEVHHMRGRAGELLLDKRGWLPVSREGHDWIHRNVAKARKLGFICERGLWGKPYGA